MFGEERTDLTREDIHLVFVMAGQLHQPRVTGELVGDHLDKITGALGCDEAGIARRMKKIGRRPGRRQRVIEHGGVENDAVVEMWPSRGLCRETGKLRGQCPALFGQPIGLDSVCVLPPPLIPSGFGSLVKRKTGLSSGRRGVSAIVHLFQVAMDHLPAYADDLGDVGLANPALLVQQHCQRLLLGRIDFSIIEESWIRRRGMHRRH